jgi:ATP-dependent Clp protease protease subunit
MTSKPKEKIPLDVVEIFHDFNLYIPTRTIYFGGVGINFEDDTDVVNCKTVAQTIKNLHILETMEVAPINLFLNTPGGSWADGIALYDIIKQLHSKVIIIGIGKLYSMGSIILQAGDQRWLLPNSSVMIHDGYDGYSGGAKSFENWAKDSKRVREIMYQIYYEKMITKNSEIKLKQIEEMCNNDTIFNAKEAVEIGLADEIIDNIKKKKR